MNTVWEGNSEKQRWTGEREETGGGWDACVIMKLFRSFARGACTNVGKKKKWSKLVCHSFTDESCSQRWRYNIMCTIFRLHVFRVYTYVWREPRDTTMRVRALVNERTREHDGSWLRDWTWSRNEIENRKIEKKSTLGEIRVRERTRVRPYGFGGRERGPRKTRSRLSVVRFHPGTAIWIFSSVGLSLRIPRTIPVRAARPEKEGTVYKRRRRAAPPRRCSRKAGARVSRKITIITIDVCPPPRSSSFDDSQNSYVHLATGYNNDIITCNLSFFFSRFFLFHSLGIAVIAASVCEPSTSRCATCNNS
jgi:hypothetical protein